jgi:MoaD family protein
MKPNQNIEPNIRIHIRTSLDFKKIFGQGRFNVFTGKGSTLGNLLNELIQTYGKELASRLFEPDGATPKPHIMLMVNGRNINFLKRLDTTLYDGDEVLILPPVSGG